jgi:hypothetical protein
VTAFTGTIPTIASGDTTSVPANLAIYRDALKGLSDPWSTYTPAWTATTTNPTLGNGTLVGHYMQVNKFVSFWIKLTLGSTTTVGSGLYQITLPVTPFSTHPVHFEIVYFDSSAGAQYRGVTSQLTAPAKVNLLYDASTAGGAMSGFTNAVPAVPATGDVYDISGTPYEAA